MSRKKITTEDFIKKSRTVHGDRFDYSKSIYVSAKTKLTIICRVHGDFEQMPTHHHAGNGCSKCSGKYLSNTEEFIQKSKLIHGDELTYEHTIYGKNAHEKVWITCPIHGDFLAKPNGILNGAGCALCARTTTTEEFIRKANLLFGELYDYSKSVYVRSKEPVIIICRKHGEFLMSPNGHLQGFGCKKCQVSRGEKKIMEVIEKLGYIAKPQFRFSDCRNKKPLPFDFGIYTCDEKFIGLIEYQGSHHYNPSKRVSTWTDEDLAAILKKTQMHDQIKVDYCRKNNIPLLVIPYWDKYKLEELILPFIQENLP